MTRWLLPLFAVGLAVACGSDEPLLGARSNTPLPDAGADLDAASPPDGGQPDSAPPRRQVFSRNPFGNVEHGNNLLWDGDFEWHSAFASQYGWVNTSLILGPSGFDQIKVGTACKSGMKCGYLTTNQNIAAIGVAASGGPVAARVSVKPPSGDCTDVSVQLFACDYGADPDQPLSEPDGAPDADGWCEFEGVFPERTRATCLGVKARFVDGEAIVDAAVVEPAPANARLSFGRPASAEERSTAEAMRRFLRQWLKPADRPQPQAAAALKRFMTRPR